MFGLNLEDWANVATILGGFAAVITLPLIWIQLVSNNRQAKRERSYVFAGKYHDTDCLPHMIRARKFLIGSSKEGILLESAWDEFNKDDNTRFSVGVLLSFFEEMGAMYNKNLVDKEVIRDLLTTVTITYFEIAKPLIDKMRNIQEDHTVYEQWGKMYNDLKKKNK